MGYSLFMLVYAVSQMARFWLFVGGFALGAIVLFLLAGLSHQKKGQVRIRYKRKMPASIVGEGWHYCFPFSRRESRKISMAPHPFFHKRYLIEVNDPIAFDKSRKSLQKSLKSGNCKDFESLSKLFADSGATLIEVIRP